MDRQAKLQIKLENARRKGKCREAYDHWVAHPHLRLVDLADKFLIGDDSLRYFLKANGLERPDGGSPRPTSGTSDRQTRIRETYEEAIKHGHDANWAVAKANEGTGKRSVNKGDFVYYAVKNDKPELADPSKKFGFAYHKMSRI